MFSAIYLGSLDVPDHHIMLLGSNLCVVSYWMGVPTFVPRHRAPSSMSVPLKSAALSPQADTLLSQGWYCPQHT